jgi:menaquinone-9 beta-reductase
VTEKFAVLIVGAGVSGASAAIRLAQSGFAVCLVERDRFPRHKLCGEFISPECLEHFRELQVFDQMMSAGGDEIFETVFYAPNGRSVAVPSSWFGTGASGALSLSRAEMDLRLLERAKSLGVTVYEETQVVGAIEENGEICGVKARTKSGEVLEIKADFLLDATGRARVLAKQIEKEISRKRVKVQRKAKLVGFKAHVQGAKIERGVCEIYSFRGGYGGLSAVENGVSNHCFLIDAKVVKEYCGNAEKIVREVVFKNRRAAETLASAVPVFDWLAVAVDGFGRKNLAPAANVLTVGDAAAFIDPFTGSGMLMALESGKIAAESIAENFNNQPQIAFNYQRLHHEKFNRRLRVCSLLRRAAFVPHFAEAVIGLLSVSNTARQVVARATRSNKELKVQN